MTDRPHGGVALAVYRLATRALSPFLPAYLRRRRARGREHPERWTEKLGRASLPRPDAPLVWLHAVGLGEVLALRGLIAALSAARPEIEFLVTSSTRASADVFARNAPPRTRHQFLPLDTPSCAARFLDHWSPDLSIWAEQDFWPGLVAATHARGIPLALVNARMDAASLASRRRGRVLFARLYPMFAFLGAQDAATAQNLEALGAPPPVRIHPSLKLFSPPLAIDPKAKADLAHALGTRPVWLVASSHAEDEAIALTAHQEILTRAPDTVLILAPRVPDRGPEILARVKERGLSGSLRSEHALPGKNEAVHIADTFGELGLFYSAAPVALIGGTFGATEGHNPWEAAHLGTAILHGPRTANFAADFAALDAAGAAIAVNDAASLASALGASDQAAMTQAARALTLARAAELETLTGALLALLADPTS